MSAPPAVRLGECCEIVSGATPKTGVDSYWDGDVLWATPKDLSDLPGKFIDNTSRKLTAAGLRSCAATVLPAGSVLLSSRAPIGHVAINSRPMATNQGFKSLVPVDNRIDSTYLYYWLKANSTYLNSLGNGATFKELSKAAVSKIEVPLLPLADQRRIASALDYADALRMKRRRALALLDDLVQAVFLDMFGNPVENARSWPAVAVGDFVDRFEGGKSLSGDEGGNTNARFRILKVSSVTRGTFDPSESKAAPLEYVPPASHFVRDGDLLFSRANTSELVGAVALVENAPGNLLMPDKLWRFVWRAPRNVHPLYVRQMFRQPRFRHEISIRATGSSGSMKNISQSKALSIRCGLPPLAIQEIFAERVEAIEGFKAVHLAYLAELDALFASLQYRAFRGELSTAPAG